MDRSELLDYLREKFNDNELRDLCFTLGIEYENLGGEGKAGKARELVYYCTRHGQLPDLERAAQQLSAKLSRGASANHSEPKNPDSYPNGSVKNADSDRGVVGLTVPDDLSQERASLQRQLTEARANLQLIEERESEYVEQTAVPLQLVKDKRFWRDRITELEMKLRG